MSRVTFFHTIETCCSKLSFNYNIDILCAKMSSVTILYTIETCCSKLSFNCNTVFKNTSCVMGLSQIILPAKSSTISTDVDATCFEMSKNGDERIDESATSEREWQWKLICILCQVQIKFDKKVTFSILSVNFSKFCDCSKTMLWKQFFLLKKILFSIVEFHTCCFLKLLIPHSRNLFVTTASQTQINSAA